MLGHRLVVVSDAHLTADSPADDEAFLQFIEQVPSLGDCLLINGDLFDFWFAYRRVIPRSCFRVTAALTMLRRKMPVVMTGGNHDRWGDSFWQQEADIAYSADELRFEIGGAAVLAIHGDGTAEAHWSGDLLHRITKHPVTTAVYRMLHPDWGIWLVDRLSRHLGDDTCDPVALERAAQRQADWAKSRMSADPGISVLIMSHTHRPGLVEVGPKRWYLNPGAWIGERRYAIVSDQGVELRQFEEPKPR